MSGGILKIGKLRHAFADGATTRGDMDKWMLRLGSADWKEI